jgi:hypothetical protein
MRTIVLFIITMVAGVSCIGPETAKALPLSAVAVADPQSKSARRRGWLATTLVSRPCLSSALRILPARLYLLSSTASRLLRACLSGVPLLSALRLLQALLRSVLTERTDHRLRLKLITGDLSACMRRRERHPCAGTLP